MLTNKLKILSDSQIDELYAIPVLGESDQWEIFELNELEYASLHSFHTLPSKLLFVLQLGYFKIKQQFWTLDALLCQKEDLKYLIHRYFPEEPLSISRIKVSKPTRLSHQKKILELCRYRRYTQDFKPNLEEESNRLVRINAKSGFIFQQILEFFEKERVVLIAYSHLQNIIGEGIQTEQNRLTIQADELLSFKQKEGLDRLLSERPDFIHSLTILKRDPKSFSYQEIRKMTHQKEELQEIALLSFEMHKVFQISRQNLQYYASMVHYYSIYRLQKMELSYCYFLLCCFLYIRYHQLNDHLV